VEVSPADTGADHYASHLVTSVAAPELSRNPAPVPASPTFPGARAGGRTTAVIRPGSRPASRIPRAVLMIGAVVGSVVLGGCAAGQVAQTAYQANSSTGATVNQNGLAIRDAQVAFGDAPEGAAIHPKGGTAPTEMHIVNQSTQNDRLVSASSPVAASVQISGQTDLPAGVSMVVGGESATGGQSAPGSAEPSAEPPLDATLAGGPSETNPAAPPSQNNEPSDTSPTGAANPTGEAPAAGLQPPPAIKSVAPSTRYAQIVLTGLREDIRAGLSYEIDLTFERAGVVRVMLPVGYPASPREASENGG
jgi:periplasmic copper chaperone A